MPQTVTAEITWEDPPAPNNRGTVARDWIADLAPLKARPGEWARVYTYEKRGSASTTAATGRKKAAGYEIVSRYYGETGSAVWARWMGNGTA